MTGDGLVDELPTGAILALCDKVLDEVGRRSHRFAWLRAPGTEADAWLPVDAYYPRHRLVVLCHSDQRPYDHLFGQLVPQHGLRLLEFAPAELGTDLAMAERVLRRMIARLPDPAAHEEQAEEARGRSPRARPATARRREQPAPARPAAAGAVARHRAPKLPSISLSALTARRPRDPLEPVRAAREQSLRGARVRPGRAGVAAASAADHAPEIVAVGVAAGLALAAIAGVELIVAVIALMLDSGRVVLGLGLALDACARVLGALDSERSGETGWAWAWAIIGSPTVVAIALGPRSPARTRSRSWRAGSGDTAIEAAPLAILIATLALVCLLVGLLT